MGAKAESFRRVPETCPKVDRAMTDLETDFIWSIRDPEDLPQDRQISRLVGTATMEIKKQTEALRDLSIEAIEERMEQEKEVEILEERYSRTSYLRNWIRSQFRFETIVELRDYSLFNPKL